MMTIKNTTSAAAMMSLRRNSPILLDWRDRFVVIARPQDCVGNSPASCKAGAKGGKERNHPSPAKSSKSAQIDSASAVTASVDSLINEWMSSP